MRHVAPFVVDNGTTRSLHFAAGDVQTRMRIDEPDVLVLEYTRLMMAFLLFDSAPRAIGIVGLGGGSLAKFCLRHLPEAQVDAVEINPEVLALREAFCLPPDGPRLRVTEGDGAAFVRAAPQLFDALLVDAFTRSGTPAQLASQAFYDDCVAALRPGGLLSINLQADHADHALHLERIRRSVAGEMLVVGGNDSANVVAIACRGDRLQRHHGATVRGLPPAAMAQLAAVFARAARALREDRS